MASGSSQRSQSLSLIVNGIRSWISASGPAASDFLDYHAKSDPEIAALKVEDLRESRLVVCDPAPIPLDEMQRTYDWLKSWGMLEETASPLDLVNMDVQRYAHQAAE